LVPPGTVGLYSTMGTLDVPGAQIYYEVQGRGPLILLIPGGNGETTAYDRIARFLEQWFRVVKYDRRGFSRSYLTEAQDYSQRLATDADDAQRLISYLSSEPATVFGSSSGAIVGLELLIRHPSAVRKLISHEAPLLTTVPGGAKTEKALIQEVYDIYRAKGIFPALERFTANVLAVETEQSTMQWSMDPRRGGFAAANTLYWFERELTPYPFAEIDMESLVQRKQQLLLVVGRESSGQPVCGVPTESLAIKLGLTVRNLPGGHLGFAFHAAEFGKALLAFLKESDQFYVNL
jgi:acetyltransferase/esterase